MNSTGKAFVIGIATGLMLVAAGIAWCQGPQPATMPTTVEVQQTWDLLPGMDKKAYAEFVKNAVATYMKAPGLIEYRAARNLLGSPQVRTIMVWQSLSDWAKFTESKEWAAIDTQRRPFMTNIHVEIWGPSPMVPKPLRPGQ
jgi:heme-degrading monooxygenase HmoA